MRAGPRGREVLKQREVENGVVDWCSAIQLQRLAAEEWFSIRGSLASCVQGCIWQHLGTCWVVTTWGKGREVLQASSGSMDAAEHPKMHRRALATDGSAPSARGALVGRRAVMTYSQCHSPVWG